MRERAPIVLLLVCVSLGILIHSQRKQDAIPDGPISEARPVSRAMMESTELAPPSRPTRISPSASAEAPLAHGPTMLQHVFRIQLDRGHCTLEKVDEVRGDFGRERAPRWDVGMLCCRLIAGDGRIISERTLPAPDYVCVVIDPNDGSNSPTAARLTSDGPALFQVRFPRIADAVRLEVHRITIETRPADAAAPIGTLLASIDIPSK